MEATGWQASQSFNPVQHTHTVSCVFPSICTYSRVFTQAQERRKKQLALCSKAWNTWRYTHGAYIDTHKHSKITSGFRLPGPHESQHHCLWDPVKKRENREDQHKNQYSASSCICCVVTWVCVFVAVLQIHLRTLLKITNVQIKGLLPLLPPLILGLFM